MENGSSTRGVPHYGVTGRRKETRVPCGASLSDVGRSDESPSAVAYPEKVAGAPHSLRSSPQSRLWRFVCGFPNA